MRTSLETAAPPTAKADAARVYTVPPGRAFLDAIANALLGGDLPVPGGAVPKPLDLPNITVLLPTRRAARALQEAFLSAGGGAAMMLPRIRPISEGEDDLTLLSGLAADAALGADALDLPPAVSEIARRLALTELVLKWSQVIRRSDDPADFLSDHAAAAMIGSVESFKVRCVLGMGSPFLCR